MKLLVSLAAVLLALSTLLLATLGTFHDDAFYDYAYQRNGAYELVGKEMALQVTENFQAFLDDKDVLRSFPDDQAAHLEEVKRFYTLGKMISAALLSLLVVLAALLAWRPDRRVLLAKTLRSASFILGGLVVALMVLGLNWEWLFRAFHELLFTGQYAFYSTTMMLQLWGGNLFVLAGAYILIKMLLVAVFLFSLSLPLRRD